MKVFVQSVLVICPIHLRYRMGKLPFFILNVIRIHISNPIYFVCLCVLFAISVISFLKIPRVWLCVASNTKTWPSELSSFFTTALP